MHISPFFTPEIKYVVQGNVCLENSPLGKCPFGEFPIWENVLRKTICRETVN